MKEIKEIKERVNTLNNAQRVTCLILEQGIEKKKEIKERVILYFFERTSNTFVLIVLVKL